jgi:type II secretory pathway component PulM
MKMRMLAARKWWHARPPRARTALSIVLVALGLVALGATSDWLRTERARLRAAMSAAEAGHKQMQDEIAEVLRLRTQSAPPPLQGKAVMDAISASLQGRKLDLAVTQQDTERVRVQGTADFDDAIAWLGAMQRDYRLRLVTLEVLRQATGVRVDIVLSPARP